MPATEPRRSSPRHPESGPAQALRQKALAIQAAVNPGNKATACASITNYLKLVNAQTGKKLTNAQASQLTSQATNLAAALGR